jgi:hypothetical protein
MQIGDNQIHVQENFVLLVIDADNSSQECGLSVH